ncbi:MAG: SAM-dependent methyltransferase [Saprospiraceae bacterium]
MSDFGTLYLLPAPLGKEGGYALPAYVVNKLHELDYLVAERAKTARRFIKSTNPSKPISDYNIQELNEHTTQSEILPLLQPLLEGHNMGLLSEAGCPGVADPGAALVELAHARSVRVAPMVGPSSILLALMASGMNGQQFCFNGYLSPKPVQLAKDLRRLEQLSRKHRQTQIFIETPYRNNKMVDTALSCLSPGTLFCVAVDLTLPSQKVTTKSITNWKCSNRPDLHKRPAVFLLFQP